MIQEFLCVKTKVGLKRKRSTTMYSSDSSELEWSVGPLRSRPLRRQSPRHRTAWGGRSAQLEYCSRILDEMLSKKHASCARPFYSLMDDEVLQRHNHHNVIRNLIDLSTIKVGAAPRKTSLACCFFKWSHCFSSAVVTSYFYPHCRKRWMVPSIQMHRVSLQTSG